MFVSDQAKQQRLDENISLDDPTVNYSTFELRQSRRGTLESHHSRSNTNTLNSVAPDTRTSERHSSATMRSTASRKSRANRDNHHNRGSSTIERSGNFAMINGSRNPPRPAPSLVRYSDEDSKLGYDGNPDDSDSLTEKPSEISSTETESEQDSTGGSTDPHSASFVNHYANVNSTFRHSQTWKRQQKSGAVAVAPPTRPEMRHSTSMGAVAAASSLAHQHQHQHKQQASQQQAPQQLQLPQQQSSQNPRGYSSFTDSDHGDASSAVVSLNGTQIVMNNMARSRAPLPGFSSFV